MSGSIGPATDRLLVAGVALLVLGITATFLLPATVNVLPPGSTSAGGSIEFPSDGLSTDGPNGTEHVASPGDADGNTSASGSNAADVSLGVDASATDGWLIPGHEAVVTVARGSAPLADVDVALDGEPVGETDDRGRLAVTVPGVDDVNVSASLPAGGEVHRTIGVADDVNLTVERPLTRLEPVNVTARIENYPFAGAAVSVDGESAGALDENGTGRVSLAGGDDRVDLSVSDGPLAEDRSFDLGLDTVFDPGYPIAASRATVDASYPSGPADVEVYVVDGDHTDRAAEVVANNQPTVRTHGRETTVFLPPASEATVVVTDGETVRAAVVDDLLRNLAIAVIAVFCVGGGLAITTVRALRWLDVDPGDWGGSIAFGGLGRALADLGSGLVDAAAALVAIPASVGLPSITLPSVGLPSLVLPSLSVPSIPALTLPSLSLPSLALPSLSLPGLSLPSVGRPSLPGRSASDDDAATPAAAPTIADEDGTPTLTDRELIRAAIRDLGRLAGVRRVETATPGQIGREALDAALPREPVERIVGTVRDVEYGGGEPSRDRASGVKRAVRRLSDALGDGGDDE